MSRRSQVVRWSSIAFAFTALAALGLQPRGLDPLAAQTRLISLVSQDQGHVALGLALRRLTVSGTLLQSITHPDDEHNQLFAYLTLGQGLRSVDVHTTRGEGGQNEIGPELFRDIGVLRTAELLAAHRLDGAEQWFTRAIDYGYSFDPEEIYRKWNRQEVVRDLVYFIRATRPDVVLTMTIQGAGGDRAHESTAVVTREAFKAAGDPTKFPDQIKAGLRPWQPRKLYFNGGTGVIGGGAPAGAPQSAGRLATVNTAAFDPLLGRTYQEIGADARSNHKCQGMGQLPPVIGGIGGGRGPSGPSRYRLVESLIPGQADKDETSLFDGIDTSLAALASFAGPNPPEGLRAGLAAILEQGRAAQQAFTSGDDAATARPVVAGLAAVRALRAALPSLGLSDQARFEIDFRLKTKEADYEEAALLAHGLAFEALADDGLVVAGQPVKVTLAAANRGKAEVTLLDVAIAGFDGKATCTTGSLAAGSATTCSADVTIPSGARLTEPYWTDEYWDRRPPKDALNIFPADVEFGVPFRPSPFRAAFRLALGGVEVTRELPVQYRYAKDIFVGEKRMEPNVVPAFSVRMTPVTAVIPAAAGGAAGRPTERDIVVSVTNGRKGAAQATVALELPAGWSSAPARAPLAFANEDESLTVRFTVKVPATVAMGDYQVKAVVTSESTGPSRFSQGYQEIDYPHIERRQVIKPAETDLKVIDVKTTPGVKIGYVVGAGDQVPPALEQLGAKVSLVQPDELAWGDLSKYDVIMTGVRAYLKRSDLRAYNRRLIEFAERGGTVIVQYNKTEFNQAQYGPYPAKVGNGRVTDEEAPVKVLVPGHPVFNVPNRLTDAAWRGWVQERGLYFLGEKDAKYVDLVSMHDSAPDNPGEKLGSLVEARVGSGRWIYLGLGLWRQLPAQTEGAYQLLSNLISLRKAPTGRRTR